MRTLGLALLLCLGLAPAQAQVAVTFQAPTTNGSVAITTGSTYQLLLAANTANPPTGAGARHSLTIQNNNSTDACYLIFGQNVTIVAGTTTLSSTGVVAGAAALTAVKASIVLPAGASYARYYPYVPSDALYVTCQTAGDSVYMDTQ